MQGSSCCVVPRRVLKGDIDLCRIFKLFFRLFKLLRISQNSYVDLFSLMAYTRCMNLKFEP